MLGRTLNNYFDNQVNPANTEWVKRVVKRSKESDRGSIQHTIQNSHLTTPAQGLGDRNLEPRSQIKLINQLTKLGANCITLYSRQAEQ